MKIYSDFRNFIQNASDMEIYHALDFIGMIGFYEAGEYDLPEDEKLIELSMKYVKYIEKVRPKYGECLVRKFLKECGYDL